MSEDRLTELLARAVDDVEPADRLAEIRARTARRRAAPRGRWGRWGLPLGAVLATAAVVLAATVLGGGPDRSPAPADTKRASAVPAYYVGDAAGGPRLFREFHADGRGFPSEPVDPDYRTYWPAHAVAATTPGPAEGELVVSLADDRLLGRPAGMSAEEARLAIQQAVYSLDAERQQRHRVRFELDGEPVDRLFGVSLPPGGEVTAAPPLETLALVNISDPAEGTPVSGRFTARGVASSFEATVPWELRDRDGAVVRRGFASAAGWIDRLHPWEIEVDVAGLAPGTYTFAAMTGDPTGGTEGPGLTTDTRTVVVQ